MSHFETRTAGRNFLFKKVVFLRTAILENRFLKLFSGPAEQGCQMAYFQTKIPIWVNFGGSCCNGR
jgi:hypothetical protein